MATTGDSTGAEMWAAFPALSGARYTRKRRFMILGMSSHSQVLDERGEVAARLRTPSFSRTLRPHLTVDTRSYRTDRHRSLRNRETGEEIARATGIHFNHQATTQLTLRDGTVVMFPVWGKRRDRAVMVATDSHLPGLGALPSPRLAIEGSLAHFRYRGLSTCEIVVPSSCSLRGDDLLYVLGFGANLLWTYFARPGGG